MDTKSYIVKETDKMKFFTYLKPIFDGINNVQKEYNWLLSDFECNAYPDPLQRVSDLELTGEELTKIANNETPVQFIWGVFSGIPKDKSVMLDELEFKPYSDGNKKLWSGKYQIQHPNAVIEIIPFDSSYFIFSSKVDEMTKDFIKAFPEAIELDEYVKNNILENEFYQAVDKILWEVWDPIGVYGTKQARNEYQNYIQKACVIAMEDDEKAVKEYLRKVESEEMGLSHEPEENVERAARMIMEAKENLKNP